MDELQELIKGYRKAAPGAAAVKKEAATSAAPSGLKRPSAAITSKL